MRPYEQLEKELAEWIGMPHVVACSSGTAALHLAFEALQLPTGSEVIMSDFNMIACPRAAVMAGLRPVFVDCDDRLCLDIDAAAAIQDRPGVGAILFTHIYGRRCKVSEVYQSARRKNLFLIEDMAEIHGVKPHQWADAACYSFYRNKIVHGEEGGCVAFQDESMARRARSLRSLGFTDKHDFFHTPRGCNYRLADLLAEPIRESLSEIEWSLAKRREIEGWFNCLFPTSWKMPKRDVVWVYDLQIPGFQSREKLDEVVSRIRATKIRGQGIEARHSFKPMSMQLEFAEMAGVPVQDENWPNTGTGARAFGASRSVFYLPVSPVYGEAYVNEVGRAVRDIVLSVL